jgi:hypothetical protein
VSCRSIRSHRPGEVVTVYVWHPEARMFLLVRAQQPAPFGATETITRQIETLSITP